MEHFKCFRDSGTYLNDHMDKLTLGVSWTVMKELCEVGEETKTREGGV